MNKCSPILFDTIEALEAILKRCCSEKFEGEFFRHLLIDTQGYTYFRSDILAIPHEVAESPALQFPGKENVIYSISEIKNIYEKDPQSDKFIFNRKLAEIFESVDNLPAKSLLAAAKLDCPISMSEYSLPVVNTDGRTYDRSSIIRWVDKMEKDPITSQPCKKEELLLNRALTSLITLRLRYQILDTKEILLRITVLKEEEKACSEERNRTLLPRYEEKKRCQNILDALPNLGTRILVPIIIFGFSFIIFYRFLSDMEKYIGIEKYSGKENQSLRIFLKCAVIAPIILFSYNKLVKDIPKQRKETIKSINELEGKIIAEEGHFANCLNELDQQIKVLNDRRVLGKHGFFSQDSPEASNKTSTNTLLQNHSR